MVLKNRPEKDNSHLFVATKSSHNQNNLISLATAVSQQPIGRFNISGPNIVRSSLILLASLGPMSKILNQGPLDNLK